MPIADIVIAVAIVISIVVGIFRGFVKEALSIVSLLVAVWAAMYFGADAGRLGENWISSEGLQLWFGRILIFVVILAIGGLLGWGISRLVRLSILSGADRALGAVFGFCRAAVLTGVFVIGGQLASFDKDQWWQSSRLIPFGAVVADWLRVMAPKGVDMLQPDEPAPEEPAEQL
ncbi:MAG: CvpA family protein [Woeseiaceae bacterium]